MAIDHDLTFKNSLGYVMDCVGQHFSQWHIILQQMTMASDINDYPAIPCNDLQILYVSWEMPGYVLG